jgi:Putative auto-transporter adhesin, head GIN domain
MKRVIYFCAIVAGFFLLTGNSFGQSVVKETRDVSGFTGVSFGLAGDLVIKFGSSCNVVLEGDSKYIKDIETVVRNGKLVIRRDNFGMFNNEKVNVYITMQEVKSLGLSGSGRAAVEGTVKTDVLELSVSGSGKISIPEVFSNEMNCSISGSGDINVVSGQVGKADLSISGSGGYVGDNVVIKDFRAGISGSGSCSCNVSESLNASISGSGNVVYSGNPKINVRSSGSGHVRSR